LANLAKKDKNGNKHREGAPATTEVFWHPSGSHGYSPEAMKSEQNEKKFKTLMHSAVIYRNKFELCGTSKYCDNIKLT
jgi:hypothetical protein